MKNLIGIGVAILLALAASAAGQSSAKLPCDYSGKLLRKDTDEIVRLQSDEMKQRTTYKSDIGDFMRRTDFRDNHVIEVLVGPSGDVLCAKTVSGLPCCQCRGREGGAYLGFPACKEKWRARSLRWIPGILPMQYIVR